MRNIKRIIVFNLLLLSCLVSKAQLITTPFVPPVNPEPTVKEIFKKIEDTLNVKQGELKVGEVQKANEAAKGFTPRPKDADEQAGAIGNATNANEVKGNINTPDKLLKEAQKAAETVEKLTATATKELRE